MPFVGINNPVKSPFVGFKIPFVRIKGFTLIELIITITIAGILMATAVPGMGNLIRNHRLSGQANDLLAGPGICQERSHQAQCDGYRMQTECKQRHPRL